MSKEDFERNIKGLATKAVEITGDKSDYEVAEKLLRCFDPETVDLIKTFTDCVEKIGKKIEAF